MDTDYDRIAEQYQRGEAAALADAHRALHAAPPGRRHGGESGDRPGLRGGVLHPRTPAAGRRCASSAWTCRAR